MFQIHYGRVRVSSEEAMGTRSSQSSLVDAVGREVSLSRRGGPGITLNTRRKAVH